MIDFSPEVVFGVIEEDMYGKLNFKGDMDSTHIFFKFEYHQDRHSFRLRYF